MKSDQNGVLVFLREVTLLKKLCRKRKNVTDNGEAVCDAKPVRPCVTLVGGMYYHPIFIFGGYFLKMV